jgi:hypothetical protein
VDKAPRLARLSPGNDGIAILWERSSSNILHQLNKDKARGVAVNEASQLPVGQQGNGKRRRFFSRALVFMLRGVCVQMSHNPFVLTGRTWVGHTSTFPRHPALLLAAGG